MSDSGKQAAFLTIPVSERDHFQGPADAPVILVEYGDYECPHCRLVYFNIRELQNQLGDRLRYVYRHLPISSSHPHAQLAAQAAESAGAQGKFWEMHDMLYGHEALDEAHLYEYAAEIGLDMERFRSDLTGNVYAQKVQEDFASGIRSGVNGTPTFFINGERYDGAWDLESLLELVEKPLGVRVRLLTQNFSRQAASGGIVLLICTVIALVWRNSPWGLSYVHFWETGFTISLGDWSLSESFVHWINDGLMVIFFFVVGLEIKRELTTGELASPQKAALPIAGAVGGMIIPALIFVFFNLGSPAESGWGIPMATDIAFMLGIFAIMGSRIPLALRIFFTALAIADDLGAILVLAVFYSSDINWLSLGIGLVIFLILIGLNRARVYSPTPYMILGIGLWLAFLESGIHPTIAGVLLAATIPSRSPANLRTLLAQVVTLLQSFELPHAWRDTVDSRRQAAVSTLEDVTERMQSPAQRIEDVLTPWVTFLILPLFALANAGVAISRASVSTLTSPLSVGIILGLVIGKPIGITFFAWINDRIGLGTLPGGIQWRQFIGASSLAGIGFTMSLFISSTAYSSPVLQESAKLAILVASIFAAIIGSSLLVVTSPSPSSSTSMAPASAAD